MIIALSAVLAIAMTPAWSTHGNELPPAGRSFHARPRVTIDQRPSPPVVSSPAGASVQPVVVGASCSYAESLVAAYSWDVGVAMAVIDRETGGTCNPGAVNGSSGTSGLFQLAPFWWNGSSAFGWVFDPLDPVQNVAYAYKIYDYENGWAPAWCAHIQGLYDPPGC